MAKPNMTAQEFRERYGNKSQRGKKRGEMNRLESAYARERLEMEKSIGAILDYKYEEIKLKLASGTWYTPDFDVYMPDGSLRFIEVKGFWRQHARIQIKVAADRFPQHQFIAVQRDGQGWKAEEF